MDIARKNGIPANRQDLPVWMRAMLNELGQHEIPGPIDNRRIALYRVQAQSNTVGMPESVPWCADIVNACLERNGIRGSRSAMARSLLHVGKPLPAPALGAITVLWRGTRNGSSGHVGLYAGSRMRNGKRQVRLLGGNQNDAVGFAWFDEDRVLGYRWPSDKTPVSQVGHVYVAVDGDGKVTEA